MKNKTLRQKTDMVIAACFALLLAVLALANVELVTWPAEKLATGQYTVTETRDAIASGYLSDHLWEKHSFVTVNGLFARASGLRVYNDVLLLNNGMITQAEPEQPPSNETAARQVADFAALLQGQGIPCFYAMSALKVDLEEKLLPAHVSFVNNDNTTDILRRLRELGVDTVDFRERVSATPEDVERYYYRTDHHWNADGAFVGYQMLMEKLEALDPEIHAAHTDLAQWERHEKKHQFLGSRGKRVGPLFAGVDDLTWYTPRFDTELSCMMTPRVKKLYKGDFESAVIHQVFIGNPNYFQLNNYGVTMSADDGLVRLRNPQAPNRKKILLIKDSYMLPVMTMLATEFTEVDAIDPRYYSMTTMAQYAAWTRPDAVIMSMSVQVLGTVKDAVYGTAAFRPAQPVVALEPLEVEIAAKNTSYNCVQLPVKLQPGASYRVSLEDVEVVMGEAKAVSVSLYNNTAKKFVHEMLLDVEACHSGGDAFYVNVPGQEANYALFVYAGQASATRDIGVRYHGVKVERLN